MPIAIRMPFDLVLTDFLVIGGTVFGFWAIRSYFQYRKIINSTGHIAGARTLFGASMLFTRFLPHIPYINRRADKGWQLRYGRKYC